MSAFLDLINSSKQLFVQQRFEMAEVFGFESRNKYAIAATDGTQVGFAAEQQKGFLGFFARQALGHWRTFEIHFFDMARQLVLRAVHPFRLLFQRLEVFDAGGTAVGAIQQRFAIFSKRFDVEDARGRVLLTVSSPFWRIWTFPFMRADRKVAVIEKKWSGVGIEIFTDKDNFRIGFDDPALSPAERQLILAGAIFVDLQYFEAKANSRSSLLP
jgi:uncharacterized protein YxjI